HVLVSETDTQFSPMSGIADSSRGTLSWRATKNPRFGRTPAMASARTSGLLAGQLGTLYSLGTVGTMTDGQLLERFLARNDAAASDAAFVCLVERHGAMVLSVCERVLGDPHEAHDAFQATFLVLVRKASSIRRRESVAGWLFSIARRVAARARGEAARHRRHLENLHAERMPLGGGDLAAIAVKPEEPDYGPLLDELDQLPERFRAPVVLHYFEGLSTEATAQRLGCARGTVLSRLARARHRLRNRLEQRGGALEAGLPATAAANHFSTHAVGPASLAHATIRPPTPPGLADAALESVVPATVAALSQGVVRTLVLSKIRLILSLLVLTAAIVSIGLAATLHPGNQPERAPQNPRMANPPRGVAA